MRSITIKGNFSSKEQFDMLGISGDSGGSVNDFQMAMQVLRLLGNNVTGSYLVLGHPTYGLLSRRKLK